MFEGKRFRFECGRRTYIMGVLNVTPDSFSDGGQYFGADDALRRAAEIQAQGADILDVGAESTAPGHTSVSSAEEIERLREEMKQCAKELRFEEAAFLRDKIRELEKAAGQGSPAGK